MRNNISLAIMLEINKGDVMERKEKVEYSTQVCDCGTLHKIDRREIGTHKYWKCISCLDRENIEFVKKMNKLGISFSK